MLTRFSALTSDQKATIIFHSGQIHADLGENEKALERFAKSYDDTLNSKYHWNLFVDGTIAFIKKDKSKLITARDEVEKAEKDHPYVKTLGNLIKCFGKPYKEVGLGCEKGSVPGYRDWETFNKITQCLNIKVGRAHV